LKAQFFFKWAALSLSTLFSVSALMAQGSAKDPKAIGQDSVSTSLGNITSFEKTSNGCIIKSGTSTLKVIFYTKDIFRIWLAPGGAFTDPAGKDIVENTPDEHPALSIENGGGYYKLNTASCVLRVYKSPLRFALYDYRNSKMIWEEEKPISFGTRTVQSLKRQPNEFFYGCGMQNGYFSHRDREVWIEKGNGWDNGGRPNPAPFYMSTTGYGVLRNTFDAGKYTFKDPVTLAHNENRFDAFYFYGPSLKSVLDEYTDFAGKPFLLPRWALGMGDANCYNKPDRDHQPQTTPVVITKVADQYVAHNMPRGWILPNDGYGCGYVKLDSVVKELALRGFHTGLWTENGVQRIATEVGQYGTRLCKLDVAWVGPGYKFALDACKSAYAGIENNSDARGFVWSVMGWAGTQKYSTVWSGDQSGSWEYIRFHIPTFTGAGLSAMNAASSDIDGIFGGSDSTYTRDLQWKCFLPVLMTMSGWAPKDKQPWIYGEPYTAINRKYLQLKMRMTPYMYTLCAEAHETGVPATRAMVLEFPEDSVTWSTSTQYQFMNGPWLLVAPVYKKEEVRDSIYLPGGTWYDYWSGRAIQGNQWLKRYPAPLDKLPLFVRQGAIIPTYPYMDYDGQRPADTLTLGIYPSGHTTFNLYEDDGSTREYRKGAFARTLIESIATSRHIKLIVHRARGDYQGKYSQRVYFLEIHGTGAPSSVRLNGSGTHFFISREDWDHAADGCYYDPQEHGGALLVKTGYLSTSQDQEWEIDLQ
jgi:alpha-glucosidase